VHFARQEVCSASGNSDGLSVSMANVLTHRCPASPDLLNIIFEPFHRWAGAQGVEVELLGDHVASTSYVDLLATSLEEIELLVSGYQAWCDMLRIQLHLTKTELWCLQLPGGTSVTLQLGSGPSVLTTRWTFKMGH